LDLEKSILDDKIREGLEEKVKEIREKTLDTIGFLEVGHIGGTSQPSHCDMNLTPGINITTRSLGQGISSTGMALANCLDKIEKNTNLIIGNGESN
jgi:hypothetical protein